MFTLLIIVLLQEVMLAASWNKSWVFLLFDDTKKGTTLWRQSILTAAFLVYKIFPMVGGIKGLTGPVFKCFFLFPNRIAKLL